MSFVIDVDKKSRKILDALVQSALDKIARQQFSGVSHAPPVTDALLERCEQLFDDHDDLPVIQQLLELVIYARDNGVPLPTDIPGTDDRNAWSTLFDDYAEPYRTPAFHLLWCANELALGRMPHFE